MQYSAALSDGDLPMDSLRRRIEHSLLAAVNEASERSHRERVTDESGASRPRAPSPETIEHFRVLMIPHLDASYNLARHLTRNNASADDIVHDAFVRALIAFPNYRGGDAKSWLLTIVRNCCMTWLRSVASERKLLDDQFDVAELEAAGSLATATSTTTPVTPDSELQDAQEVGVLRELLAKLSPMLREVIVLREFEDMSYRQIAAIIDAPIGTVMSRLARARAQLTVAYRQSAGALGAP